MPLFQNAVLNKYLSGIDDKKVNEAWEAFTGHFHNPEVQQNIREAKEESYQEGFLDDLFVKVLGYTKSPAPDYNLVAEQKNLTDSKKADGALLDGGKVRGVIELKGTETTDLGKVEDQAFGYRNKQPDALYVIISNFEKLRFYIDNAVDFLEFNLFTLTKEEFKVLWLCLSYPNFAKGLPKKIKDASLTEEENVTKKLYKDYSEFKHAVFESIKKHNPEYNKLLLFKKTQKLLDRFLFIFFAEDQQLLPANSIKKIIQEWQQLRDLDEYRPLYKRFVKYFGYLNSGRKIPDKEEIFAYNGGLFAKDEILDNISIDDELLYKHTLKLSTYDFGSDVDVNILGHIFEHSLNEIEEITAELEGQEVDTSKTRRKKDGVFYTPKYITKYIVENTVGKLCEDKKAELDIVDERFTEAKRRTQKGIDDLKNYREWLLNLTICDPACGSGAFLNQALEFLIEEHKYIDELKAKYHGEALVLSDIENQILENNLFGVDINEESVEIAKLSLWLRTAQKGRKLTSLNNHIKCGNSLIDDPEVAGDKAFNWEREFPTVFRQKEKQAFHVTWVTHNARTSQRMKQFGVEKGDPFLMSDAQEDFVTREIARIVKEDKRNVMAYNICRDHVHILLVCEPDELSNIVRKLKGRSSQKLKEALGIPKEEKFQLWAQKFNRKPITDPDGLSNVQQYIFHNRRKHGLPPLDGDKLDVIDPLWEGKLNNDYEPGDQDNGLQPIAPNERSDRDKGLQKGKDKGLQPLASANDESLASAGKSLSEIINDMCLTEEKAFRPEYTGGFDVVIGNPPYLRIQGIKDAYPELPPYYEKNFQSATGNYDIYVLFMERSYGLINETGQVSFILPHKFLISEFGQGIREFLAECNALSSLLHFEEHLVFEVTTYTCIINFDKKKHEDLKFAYIEPEEIINPFEFEEMSQKKLSGKKWNLMGKVKARLFQKLADQPYTAEDIFEKIFVGLQTSADKIYLIEGDVKGDYVVGYSKSLDREVKIENGLMKPQLKGQDVSKYCHLKNIYYVIFPYILKDDGTSDPMTEDYIKEHFPKGYEYLKKNEKDLRGRESGKMDKEGWFLYIYPKSLTEFEQPKIVSQEISKGTNMTFDNENMYHATTVYSFILKEPSIEDYKYYLSILNSNLMWFYLTNTGTVLRGGYFRFKTKYLYPFPLPEEPKDKKPFIEKVDSMLKLNKDFQKVENNFSELLLSKFEIDKLSKKLQSWHELTFKQFLKELKKKKVELTLDKEAEWMDYFNRQKALAYDLKSQIAQTDADINAMVYELYGLGEEEVKVVEGAV